MRHTTKAYNVHTNKKRKPSSIPNKLTKSHTPTLSDNISSLLCELPVG